MSDVPYRGKAVHVERDAGYKKIDYISPQNRKKARKHMDNPNRVSSKELLMELFGEIGIIVNPNKMSYWYQYNE